MNYYDLKSKLRWLTVAFAALLVMLLLVFQYPSSSPYPTLSFAMGLMLFAVSVCFIAAILEMFRSDDYDA